MTVKEKFEQALIDNGMWPKEATQVMDSVIAGDKAGVQWNSPEEGYTPQLFAVLWFNIKQEALKYIDAHCPHAWYRGCFV